jgi:hypothetical protein
VKLEVGAQSIMAIPVKREADGQKSDELNDLLELKRAVDAGIQMYGQVSQLDHNSLISPTNIMPTG